MKWLLAVLILSLASAANTATAQHKFKVSFTPESEKYAQAAREYQEIWSGEGARIIEAMESVSGLKFAEREVRVIVYEGVSWSGRGDTPMKLRASYPSNVKKATLIHEFGHRLIAGIRKTKEVDEHRALFLILYDIWEQLYGKDFADKAVEVENKRKGLYDYEGAWKWALSMSKDARAAKFKALRDATSKE